MVEQRIAGLKGGDDRTPAGRFFFGRKLSQVIAGDPPAAVGQPAAEERACSNLNGVHVKMAIRGCWPLILARYRLRGKSLGIRWNPMPVLLQSSAARRSSPDRKAQDMNLSEYFEQAKGIGVLTTTDMSGQVNQAIFTSKEFARWSAMGRDQYRGNEDSAGLRCPSAWGGVRIGNRCPSGYTDRSLKRGTYHECS